MTSPSDVPRVEVCSGWHPDCGMAVVVRAFAGMRVVEIYVARQAADDQPLLVERAKLDAVASVLEMPERR